MLARVSITSLMHEAHDRGTPTSKGVLFACALQLDYVRGRTREVCRRVQMEWTSGRHRRQR